MASTLQVIRGIRIILGAINFYNVQDQIIVYRDSQKPVKNHLRAR